MDDHQFHRLLAHFGFSQEGYRRVRKGVKKRLRRHMQELGCQRLTSYLETIEAVPHRRSECLRRLSVPISRFMRDEEFWETLTADMLPHLVRRFGAPLAVWSAGCACGEEAYSLVISDRSIDRSPTTARPLLNILATDRNPANLVRARKGVYPRSSFRELRPYLLTRHFTPLRGGRRFRIRSELQSGIEWLCCDINDLPVSNRFHLVLLRNNILTYGNRAGREQGLQRVVDRLQPGGVLVIGRRERLPATVAGLERAFGLPYVFEWSPGKLRGLGA